MTPKTFIRLFYAFQFFFDFIFIYAVEKLYFLRQGLDLSQIGVLLLLWSVMSMILEVPTGTIADRWSRRKMLILSGIFFAMCYLIWVFSNSFWLFLLGFAFRTLGATFASGTLQAYVYDFLKKHNIENDFEKIWGRGNALRTFGIGTAVLIGGFLSQLSYSLTLIASSVSILSISLIAIIWPEITPLSSTKEEKYWQFIKRALVTVKNNRNLLVVLVFSGIILASFANLEEFNDVYMQFLSFPNWVIGVVFAIATVGQSLASLFAHKLKQFSTTSFTVIALLGFVSLVLVGLVKHPLLVIIVMLLGIFLELGRVLAEGIIQKEAEPSQRATVSSLNSFVMNLIPFQLAFGVIAHRYNIQLSYIILGTGILSYFLFLPFLKRNSQP